MNKSYRLIWSRMKEAWVVVSEKVAAKGARPAVTVSCLAAALLLATSAPALALDPGALPTGGRITAGGGSIEQGGNTLTVNQQTGKLVAHWDTFDIGRDAAVRFNQPGASSVALNRIFDQNPSQIFGNLSANGQVFLLNPAGIVFGPNARVDVGSLVASSLDMADTDFLAGNYRFSGEGGGILNQGGITAAEGGVVALIAPKVSNEGTITTPEGSTLLAAGSQVSLDFNGDGLLHYSVDRGAVDAQVENNSLIKADGGLVVMTAQAADELTSSVVNNKGIIEASSLTSRGGRIILDGDMVVNTGALDASGESGGTVTAQADYLMNAGAVAATGNNGDGGQILLQADRIVQSDAASLDVSGTGTGGDISLIAGAGEFDGIFSSVEMTATGKQGGNLTLAGNRIDLRGATLDASGEAEGGSIRVGGDLHGGAWSDPISGQTLTNAQITDVSPENTLDVSASSGAGGSVVVWSEQKTYFYGDAKATGATSGGFVEISSKDRLQYGGSVDASSPEGVRGTVLFDPKNIVIDNAAGGGGISYTAFVNPNPSADSEFGSYITTLSTGNMVVTDSLADVGAVTNAGAVYLFKADGTLISALTGSHAEDQVGYDYTNWQGGPVSLTNGNFAVSSPAWDGFKGAVTWGDGTTGVSGIVSSTNSLVGSQANDRVGSSGSGWNGVYALTNGNYVVTSPYWANGSDAKTGAATWVDGSTGQTIDETNTISSANSLIGSTANDQVGAKNLAVLTNGNYAVVSPWWDNGGTTDAGAVTWGNGSTGTAGTVSLANSLVGTRQSDSVGMGEATALTNGNYVVSSFYWHNASNTQVGAATWVNGSTGQTMNAVNTISSANSLVGSTLYDNVGMNGGNEAITALSNGNYVVISRYWDNGALADAGAATWGDGANGTAGAISSANSLIGTAAGHDIGGAGAVALDNGNYVVMSPYWDNGATLSVGAATWVNGSTGQTSNATNSVSSANSLIGSAANNRVGSRVTALSGGNYVVGSDQYNSGAGAATWVNGSTGQTSNAINTISSSNSLVGSTTGTWNATYNSYMDGDHVGENITVLTNGNYVVNSPQWNSAAGAVTWGNKDTGVVGAVSSSNSLVGTVTSAYDQNYYGANIGAYPAGDKVGSSVTALTNGNYVVASYNWSDGGISKVGAVTWGDGTIGTTGTVSAANSLVGSTVEDKVGYGGVVALDNGNYVVGSPLWDNGADVDAGAVTWADGTTGLAGTISADNSLIGAAGKQLGTLVVAGAGDIFGAVDSNYAGGGVYSVLQASAYAGGYNFANNADQAATLTSASLTEILNAGSNLILQANNDITVSSAVTVNNPGGDGGNLTLQAGRSILVNANIATDNGDLTLVANETAANGVVDAQRDVGASVITMAGGTSINAGAGAVNISLKAGDDKTNFTSGDITLTGVTAGNLTVHNQGLTDDSGIAFNGTTTLGGDLTVGLATGNLTQSGALAVSGTTGITAGANDVTLDTSTNNFSGTVSVVSANNMTLKDANALAVGTVNVSGNLNVAALGGDLTLSGDISKTSGSDATATFKASNNIIQNSAVSVSSSNNKLNAIYWADSDGSSAVGTPGGGVLLKNGASINTNGGQLWMGGGSGSVAWNGLTVGNGYAVGNNYGLVAAGDDYTGIALGTSENSGISLLTSGGNIALFGESSADVAGHKRGIGIANGATINSGTGTILVDGKSTSTNTEDGWRNAIEVINGAGATTITSANTSADAIIMRGDASTADTEIANGINGVQLNGANTVISATAGGGIDISGKANTDFVGSNIYDMYLTNASVLANSGRIKLTGQTSIGTILGSGVSIGQKSESAVTASTSNIEIIADRLTFYGIPYLQSSGTLTLKPYTAGTSIGVGTGAGTLSLTNTRFSTNFVDGFSNITIGSADAGDITVAGIISYKDPLTLKTAGNVMSDSAFSLTGSAGQTAHLTLWSDADANNDGYISIRDGSTINTNGGNIVMAGGLDDGANGGVAGDGIPDGYAFSTVSTSSGISIGRNNNAATTGTTINTYGGNILMRGKSTGGSPSMGIHFANSGTLNAGVGALTMLGEATNYNGIELSAWVGTAGLTILAGTIDIAGTTASASHHGLATSEFGSHYTTLVGGAGGVRLYGENTSNTQGIQMAVNMATTDGGNILIESPDTFWFYNAYNVHSYNADTGNITLRVNGITNSGTAGTTSFTGSGSLLIEPYTAGTTIGIGGGAGTLHLASSYFNTNFADGFSEITVGNTTAGAITIGGATSFRDDMTLLSGSTIAVNGAVTANEDLTLTSNGAITQSAALEVGGTTSITAGAANDVTLTNTGNDFTSAVSVVSGNNVSMIDKNAMTLGAVTAAGQIDIATLIGDLTLAGAVTTSDTTASAIKVNAGKSAATGAAAGGNILISGGALSTGGGGFTTLYSGSATNADLTALLGSGSGRFRYNADETTDFSTGGWTALSAGTNAIYREQPTVMVTAGNDSKTYNGLGYSGGNGVTRSGFVNGDTSAILGGTLTYGGTSQGAINAGSYTLTPGGYTNGLGYALSFVDGSLTVNKANATVTANSDTLTYNGLAQSVNGFTATGLVNGETIAVLTGVSTSGGSGTNAGSYAHTVSGSANNYNLSFVAGALIITPAPLTITANADSKTYDGLAYSGGNGVTFSGFVNSEGQDVLSGSLNYTGTSQGATHAGSYVVTPEGLTSGSGNYSINFADGTLTINKANATVTANSDTLTYNGLAQSVSGFTATGLVNGETTAVLTDVSTSGGSGTNAGSYTHTVSGNAANYNLSFVAGALIITPAPLTITANADSKTYDGLAYSGGNGVTFSGFVNSEGQDVLSGSLNYTGTSQGATHAGSYVVTPEGLTSGSGNYNLSFVDGALTISPKGLTVNGMTAQGKTYDGTTTATLSGGSLDGVIGGDTVGFFGQTGTFADKNAGSGKSVTVTGVTLGGTDAGNYTVSDPTGLTADITQKTLTVDGLSAEDKTYDGTVTVSISDWGSVVTGVGSETLTLSHGSAAFADKNVGADKTVTAIGYSLADGDNGGLATNYQLSSTSAVTSADIHKKAITVTADGQSKIYGAVDPTLTYDSDTALVGTDSFIGALDRVVGENVGAYAIGLNTLTIADGNGGHNYALAYIGNELMIEKRAIGLTADPSGKIRGEADPALSVSITSGSLGAFTVNDSLADVIGVLSRESGENVGNYDILLGSGAKSGNYAITFENDNNAFVIQTSPAVENPIMREFSGVISSLTSSQRQMNGTQQPLGSSDISESDGNDRFDMAMGPSGGNVFQGTFMDGLVIDRTGYLTEDE